MDNATAFKIVRRFKDLLERDNISVVNIELFGSCATGKNTDTSDIDVVVVSDSFVGLNHWQRIEKMSNALYELFEPIEARALTISEWASNENLTAQYAKSGKHLSI